MLQTVLKMDGIDLQALTKVFNILNYHEIAYERGCHMRFFSISEENKWSRKVAKPSRGLDTWSREVTKLPRKEEI